MHGLTYKEDLLEIEYTRAEGGHGTVRFDVRGFFPVPKAQFKKILTKIVALDDKRLEHREHLVRSFEEMIIENEEEAKVQAKIYVDYQTHAAEEKAFAKKPFHTDGSRVTDEEFKEMMKKVRHYRAVSRDAKDKGNRLLKENEKLQNHIDIIQEFRW